MKNKLLKFNLVLVLILSFLVLISEADAQTTRRRKKTKPANIPPVVKQNEQYIDGNQIVFGEIPTTQTQTEPTTLTENNPPAAETEMEDGQIKDLNSRLKKLESTKKGEYDQKQQRLLLNLDILTRAESRAESLRKQLFEMIEKENSVKTRLEQLQFDARPELIERTVATVGSLRPEELRDQRRKSLAAEKTNLESLLTQIQTSRAILETNVGKADALVEKVRTKLDKEIDDALVDENP